MSILSKKDIAKYLKEGKIVFHPFLDQYQLQPHAIDLRLGYTFYIPRKWKTSDEGREAIHFNHMDSKTADHNNFDMVTLTPGQYFEILPQEFVIASSLEKIALKDDTLMATMYTRSSLQRRGIFIAGGTIDVKYSGMLSFPIINNTDTQIIKLFPGERICHLVFEHTSSPLTDEEAKMHGMTAAKYLDRSQEGMQPRMDSDEEMKLIKDGNIDRLKEEFII